MKTLLFKAFPVLFALVVSSFPAQGQPFVDIVQLNHQRMQTSYDNSGNRHVTQNSFANILLPIKIDSSNMLIVRLNTERMQYAREGQSDIYYQIIGGIGWQHQLNKKWNVTGIFMPKITSDLIDPINSYDYQFGGTVLFQYKPKSNIRYKFGTFYNTEPFGNFFVPLLGVDWQINEKNWIYGNLPLNMRYEHRFAEKLYAGAGVRIYGRSYRMSSAQNHDYLWNQENQLKLFADYYFTPSMVVYAEAGRSLGYGLRRFSDGEPRENELLTHPLYQPVKDGFFVNLGCAFRVRRGI